MPPNHGPQVGSMPPNHGPQVGITSRVWGYTCGYMPGMRGYTCVYMPGMVGVPWCITGYGRCTLVYNRVWERGSPVAQSVLFPPTKRESCCAEWSLFSLKVRESPVAKSGPCSPWGLREKPLRRVVSSLPKVLKDLDITLSLSSPAVIPVSLLG